jgi:hypothetical protein
MLASILAFFKSLADILGITKWLIEQTKDTQTEKEQKVEATIQKEEQQAKEKGRPTWE